jgi:hypothetical protein
MIVWQGAGFTGVLVPMFFMLAGQYGLDAALGTGYYSSHTWSPVTMLLASSIVLWFFGNRLENRPGRELIDPQTQEKVVLKEKHTIFWMPLHYFAVVLAVIAVSMPFLKDIK